MPEPTHHPEDGEIPPVRISDSDLESIEASVRRLLDRSEEQARQLDNLSSAPPAAGAFGAFGIPGLGGVPPQRQPPEPRPIVELEGEEYEDELDALSDWVDGFLLRVYGSEVTTTAPWCEHWQEHEDVVAWLHALWLAYQHHKDPESGLSGLFVWHRDFLTHAMAAVRAAGGPLSACTTDPDRPAHRLLPGPAPSPRSLTTSQRGTQESGEPDRVDG